MNATELLTIILGSGTVSGLVTLLANKWFESRSQKRNAAHQARLVAEHLENFAFGCAGNAFANWRILVEDHPGALISAVPAFPPFSDKIEWTGLDSESVDAARRLEQDFQIGDAQTKTAFTKSSESGFRFAFAETLRLGNEALRVAARIRAHYRLKPLRFDPPRWDWVIFLRGEFEKLDARKRQIEEKARRQERLV